MRADKAREALPALTAEVLRCHAEVVAAKDRYRKHPEKVGDPVSEARSMALWRRLSEAEAVEREAQSSLRAAMTVILEDDPEAPEVLGVEGSNR